MKRLPLALFGLLVLALSACQSLSYDELYARLLGDWTVDKGSRPQGWQDETYSFATDDVFIITYDGGNAPYVGIVTGLNGRYITVKKTSGEPSAPATTTMYYMLDSSGTGMRLGWDSATLAYSLKLSKK
jgi:hypothetical protein